MRLNSRIQAATVAVACVAALAASMPGAAQASYFQAPQSAGFCAGVDNLHGIGDFGLRGAKVALGNTIGGPSPAAPLAQGFGYDTAADYPACAVFKTPADGGTKVFDYSDTGPGSCLAILGTAGPRQFTTVNDVGYCATEDAPTEAQIFAAEGGPAGTPAHPSEAQLLTVPLAQVAVAVDVRLPDGCQVADHVRRQISRLGAEAAFRGTLTTWGDIFGTGITATGVSPTSTECRAKPFKRVVRKDSSGTTSLLKRYLRAVSELPGGSGLNWDLVNDAWPNDGGATAVVRGDENGAASQLDKLGAQSVDGGIAYADVATSRSKDYAWDYTGPGYVADDRRLWLRVQRVVNDSYNSPAISNAQVTTGASLGSACVGAEYDNQPTTNLGQSWAATTAVATPADYSICGLNYVVTSLWGFDTEDSRYKPVWAGSTAGEFRAVKDYLRYVTGAIRPGFGQSKLPPAGYARLPADVQATARCAVKQIGWLRAGSDSQPSSPVSRDPTGADSACRGEPTYAWGDNDSGQLGNGTTTGSSTPITVSGLPTASAVAGGYSHSLAVLSDGTVRAWGDNTFGQLGDGTTTNSSTPVAVSGLSAASAVAGGLAHSLAVLSDGTVRAWGYNAFGQLGDGTTTDSPTPITVPGLTTATAVAGRYIHSLALLSDGTVRAWGDNRWGQLGDGTTTDRSTPVAASGLTTATAVASGNEHSVALLSDGTVRAWGANYVGQLGDGTTTESSTPVTVSGLTDVVAIVAGSYHNLARKADGTLWAWGYNGSGQLGDLTRDNSTVPVRVAALASVGEIAAGGLHSLALPPRAPSGLLNERR